MKNCMVLIVLISLFAIVVRWAISLYLYSGAGKPPMFGDYEAQRHWMEIAYNLPVEDWYRNTTDNDLQYWGLDYPPLTAHHSWLMGFVASRMNSSWVALHESRGHESYDHKLFMRYSVLIVDVLFFIPATFFYFLHCSNLEILSNQLILSTLSLLYPGLILIDYGHFQYNCVSLGLALWGVIGLCKGHDLLGSIAFMLAINYKQMELYHAVPFFCFLLGGCVSECRKTSWTSGLLKLAKLSAVVMATFFVCWFPFLRSWELFGQVLHRMFPFARGLFEDKVANIWCSLSTVIKFKQIFDISSLVKICLSTTLLFLIPSSLDLLLRPSIPKFKYSLVNISLVFFLFSFQVHEKSILLAALPVCLLLPDHFFPCIWFLIISTFSMLPLLIKDGLTIAYLASMVLFYMMANILTSDEFQAIIMPKGKNSVSMTTTKERLHLWPGSRLLTTLFGVSVAGMVILTILILTMQPTKRFPDLYSVAISSFSCVHFLSFLIYFHWCQFSTVTECSLSKSKFYRESVTKKNTKLKSN